MNNIDEISKKKMLLEKTLKRKALIKSDFKTILIFGAILLFTSMITIGAGIKKGYFGAIPLLLMVWHFF